MATEWVNVADNAVKIGLGSALTILGGYLTLKLSQRHELRKEALDQFQGFASEELRREKAAIEVMNKKRSFWFFGRR